MKAIQQLLRGLIRIQIDVGVGLSVASQELAQLQRLRRVPRAHQDQIPISRVDQRQPPQDERAHQDLAQLRVLGDHRPQFLRTDLQKFARRLSPGPDQRRRPEIIVSSPVKVSVGIVGHDQTFAFQVRLHESPGSPEKITKNGTFVSPRFK